MQIPILNMEAEPPIILNQQLPKRYGSISSKAVPQPGTLDEPLTQTIKRDFSDIYQKVSTTLKGTGDYQKIRKQWDLWGPLVISLITASMGAFGTGGSMEQAFTIIFLGMWLGPLIITVNANLLGAQFGIMPTLCLIVYCSSPIMLLAVAVFTMNSVHQSFLVNLLLAGGALAFVLRTNMGFFNSFIVADRRWLSLYPVFLFYTFMGLFIAMT